MTIEELKALFTSFENVPFAKGGQKMVFSAIHPQYGPTVVKILLSSDARTEREIDLVKRYHFKDVPRIFEVVEIDYYGKPTKAIVEERVIGKSLRNEIESGHRYALDEAVDFVESILRIIEQVWSHRIVHRDIKPENIILRPSGQPCLIDFGIARALDEDSITKTNDLGPFTPGYAAPEIFTLGKNAIDTRADLYSIGVVTYELITGENPFLKNASNILQVLYNTTTITPLQHTIDGDTQSQFMGFLSSMMSKDRFARPRNASEAIQWLNAAKKTFQPERLIV